MLGRFLRRSLAASLVLGAAALPACDPPPPSGPVRDIVFPLSSFVKYTDTFGAARSGGRSHEGQDLMAPKGMVAVAAASGTVTYLRWAADGLSGNMLRITDAEGWQYVYIHINNDQPGTDDGVNVYDQAFVDGIRQGQNVVAGEPVAYVGDSGNAENTGSHLHFELRSPDGAAVNAYPSLRASHLTTIGRAQVEAAAPFGAVDEIGLVGPGTAHLAGWALDKVSENPVHLTAYVDGNPQASAEADVPRPDVAAATGRGPDHGYSFDVVGIPAGIHSLCLIFHNAGEGGGSARPACTTVVVA